MYDPWMHAGELGLTVTVGPHVIAGDETGLYEYPSSIYLVAGLTQNQGRAVLAHEIQHAIRGHRRMPLTDDEDRARELEVDEAAAAILMPREWVEEVERVCGNLHERTLADHFRVDVHVVRIRLAMLERSAVST
jgi:Zn-dependent peptidase ImmA (M78 family)